MRRFLLVASSILIGTALLGSPVRAQRVEDASGLATPPAGVGVTPPPTSTPPVQVAPDALPTPRSVASGYVNASTGDIGADARLGALDGHLSSLAARRRSGAFDGVIMMLLGGAYVGLGTYELRHDADQVGKYFILAGAGSLANAGVHFGLQPNPERAYTRFQSLAGDPSIDARTRVRLSEDLLHSMARRRMASRYVQATINLGIAIGSIPLLIGSDGFDSGNAFDWMIIATSSFSVVSSITTMVQRSEEERRWRMYQQFAEHHASGMTATGPRLHLDTFSFSPMPAGGNMMVRFIF